MGFVPFIRILLRNQRSNKAATFGSMFGILISIAFITGSFMTSDAIVSDLFKDQLEEIEYHFTGYGYTHSNSNSGADISTMMNELREIDGVKDAGLIKPISTINLQNSTATFIAIDEGAARFFFERNDVILPQDGRSCIISTEMAEGLDLSVGDSFNITYYDWIDTWIDEESTRSEPRLVTVTPLKGDDGFYETEMKMINMTVNISMVLDVPGRSSFGNHVYLDTYTIFFGLNGSNAMEDELGSLATNYYPNFYSMLFFKLDPDHFSNVDDPLTTRIETRELKKDMRWIMGPNGFSLEGDRVEEIYDEYVFWSISLRIFLVILALPLLLLCFYLVLVGSRIGMENKVQEISLLKVKGATRQQVFWMLMLESLLHSVVGTTAGIVIGTLFSVFMIFRFLGKEIGIVALLPGTSMVITLLILVSITVFLIRYRSMSRLSRMDILQAVRGSPERVEKDYAPTKDIVSMVTIGSFIALMSFFNLKTPDGNFQLIIFSILELIKPLLILFLPFLLIMSISRFMVMGIPGTLDLVARPFRSMNRELHGLMVSGLKYRKRTAAIMTILISITASFGILVLSQMETRENAMEASVDSSVPSDLLVAAAGSNPDMRMNISSIEGVESVVGAQERSVNFGMENSRNYEYWWAHLISFNVGDYIDQVSPSGDLLVEGKWIDELEETQTVPSIVINRMAAREFMVVVGDLVNITIDYQWQYSRKDVYFEIDDLQPVYLECRVVGIVDHLPGLRSSTSTNMVSGLRWGDVDNFNLIDLFEEPAIYISEDMIPTNTSIGTWSFLVDVDGNRESVNENISSLGWVENLVSIVDREEVLSDLKDDPANRGMNLLLLMQFFFVLTAVVVGIFLMQVVQNTTRKRDFAEVLARGATKDNIFRLLLAEGLVILIVGLVIGTVTGFIVGYAFQTVFTGDWASSIGDFGSSIDVENRISIENSVVFPPTILILHSLIIASMVLSIYLVSRFTSRIDIASNLRMRRS